MPDELLASAKDAAAIAKMVQEQDEQEALASVRTDPLMRPDQWPMLERPRNAQEFGEVVLTVSQTRAGRLLINELVVGFLLASAADIPAARHQGQADVVRYLLQHLGLGLSRGSPQGVDAQYFNPWRNQHG
jgi:hypothetical protein